LEGNLQGHIGAQELGRLLEESRQRAHSTEATEAHPHLAACMTCREQFQELVFMDRRLKRMQPTSVPLRDGGCPDSSLWRQIAGGLTPPDQTLIYIEHASRCDLCGPLLHWAVSELTGLSMEWSEAERKAIANLESANPEWQRRLAQRIAGVSISKLQKLRWRWLSVPQLSAVALSALALFVAGWWSVTHLNQPAAADKLLARAYTEKRTLELRIQGADYAPLRISRGVEASFSNRPPALLKAEAIISAQLQSHPADPAWLRAKAQADVLEGKYDAAVESLRRALELDPHSPVLLTDIATAYFQRAEQEDRKDDLGAAYELLSQALKVSPNDAVVLFNRAIVAEHQFLYQQALDDWEHYLREDPSSQWSEEARNRANAVREMLKQHGSKANPLLSPARVAGLDASSSIASEMDERIDEYLHEAVRSWLSLAFPEVGKPNPDASKALFFLAQLAQERHFDRWLVDVLRGTQSPNFPHAVGALARAVKANDEGAYNISHQQAEFAERFFSNEGNAAGVLRARFEWSFGAQMERNSGRCRAEATGALAEAEHYSYPWLQIQLGLEKGVCSALMGDVGADEKASAEAMAKAKRARYEALYLRAVGFGIDGNFASGDQIRALNLADDGLRSFWSGHLPAMRGYNLYDDLAFAAEAAGQPHLQLANWREAIGLVDGDEDLLLRAEAHSMMANAAVAAEQPRMAGQQYSEASRLYAAAPQTEATRTHRIEQEIRTAQFEARHNSFDAALAGLIRVQSEIRRLSDNYMAQMFYSTLGEVELRSGHYREAEQAFRPAIALADQSLASLHSEEERINWSTNTAAVYLGLAEAELVQSRSRDALETYQRYLGAPERLESGARSNLSDNAAGRDLTQPHASLIESRIPLMTKETVLTYAVLPDGLAIWIYDDRGINVSWTKESTDDLKELVQRFRDLASDPTSELIAMHRDGRSLYEALIAPVEARLVPGRALVIEAEGWLAAVPLEALIDSNHHYLIERAAVIHSLGQEAEASLRSDSGTVSELPALVVASTASSRADGLIPLPDVAAEADIVGRDFHAARILKGSEATLGAVRHELPEAGVFHFAGHSVSAPGRTGLMLNGEKALASLLDASTVRKLDLKRLQLAVLSACGTASGSGGSSGFNNVTGSFLRAGVPHVVASRWAVDSAETRSFVEDFYHNTLSGQPVSEALRQTERKMLANPRTSHPYYWSAFAAYGRP
jgi:CHAT domain-containing protein/cytochrome c-type biogenesis protein CcmH/NrfG